MAGRVLLQSTSYAASESFIYSYCFRRSYIGLPVRVLKFSHFDPGWKLLKNTSKENEWTISINALHLWGYYTQHFSINRALSQLLFRSSQSKQKSFDNNRIHWRYTGHCKHSSIANHSHTPTKTRRQLFEKCLSLTFAHNMIETPYMSLWLHVCYRYCVSLSS